MKNNTLKGPGNEYNMSKKPESHDKTAARDLKLANKIAIVTGGDSGIGKAVAIAFAKEGAKVIIFYLNEHKDAQETKAIIESYGVECMLMPGDLTKEKFAIKSIEQVVKRFKKIDILVNNAGEQHPKKSILEITEKQLSRTFQTNVFSQFFMVKACLPFMKKNSTIINTASVTAYRGHKHLIDYSATKGAVVSFTRSLSEALIKKGIRVNAVAPGAVWTPMVTSTLSKNRLKKFGTRNMMKRPGQPVEIAPAYVFLSSNDSSFITGQVIHPNGGEIING